MDMNPEMQQGLLEIQGRYKSRKELLRYLRHYIVSTPGRLSLPLTSPHLY